VSKSLLVGIANHDDSDGKNATKGRGCKANRTAAGNVDRHRPSPKPRHGVAHLAKPSGGLDLFAASFKIYIHQHNIGQILHRL
jgi:hypothetical protein